MAVEDPMLAQNCVPPESTVTQLTFTWMSFAGTTPPRSITSLMVRIGVRVAALHVVATIDQHGTAWVALVTRRDDSQLLIGIAGDAANVGDRAVGIESRRRRIGIGELVLEARVGDRGLEQRAIWASPSRRSAPQIVERVVSGIPCEEVGGA